ncbi:MAG TPA: hypothetical protein VM557_13390 [Thermoanaerobaculia bacterium]|nr:hypothetical protein [Thermoanaerobaculia bacterium]
MSRPTLPILFFLVTAFAASLSAGINLQLSEPVPHGCLGVVITGSATTDGASGTVARIDWEWGDGTASQSSFPASHDYASAGSYLVKATAVTTTGEEKSIQIWAHVGPPVITRTPPAYDVAPGGQVTLGVTVTGTKPMMFQWLQNGHPVGTSSPSLTTGPLFQTATFHVHITSYCGSTVGGPFTVTVRSVPAPRFEKLGAIPQRIRPGQPARLFWSAEFASSVTISGGEVRLPKGTVEVRPEQTTTYTLTANGPGGATSADVTVEVLTEPLVTLASIPNPIVQGTGAGGSTSSYVLTNEGGSSTEITLSQEGAFFTQEPEAFTLAPGQSQTVTLTGLRVPQGGYRGASMPVGNGVREGVAIPVLLLSWPSPSGPTAAEPVGSRIDVGGPEGSVVGGVARFRNTGQAPIAAIITSDVDWIVPQAGPVEVSVGEVREVSFTIDRSKRPEEARTGSARGRLRFTFRQAANSSGKRALNGSVPVTTSFVTVVDTTKPVVVPGTMTPLGVGELAFFLSGMGHIQGSVGLYLSDLNLATRSGTEAFSNLDLFFTPLGLGTSTLVTSVPLIQPTSPVSYADVVFSVFGSSTQLGSMQFRGAKLSDLIATGTVFNVSNPTGTFGTTIPLLRSDRSAGVDETIHLTGLRKNATSHTNLYLQETTGLPVTVDATFYDASGNVIGVREYPVGAFGLQQIQDPLEANTVSMLLKTREGSTGRVAAYATPVDRASGDTWAVADWKMQLGYEGDAEVIVPVAGSAPGANGTYFRTDLALMNHGDETAVGTLTFFPRGGGAAVTRELTLVPKQTRTLDDVTAGFFEIATPTVGFIKWTPAAGRVTVTSRTFTTALDGVATYGSSVATVPRSDALQVGDVLRIGGLEDSSLASVLAASPGTFRTNIGLAEVGGASLTVRAALHFSYPAGTRLVIRGTATRDYTLAPNEFLMIDRISRQLMGEIRDEEYGDMTNMQLELAVIDGEGSLVAFSSSTDNGTGDAIIRVD